MKKIFSFQKDKNRLKLLLFRIKEKKVFIEDYKEQTLAPEDKPEEIIKQFLLSSKAGTFKTICFLPLSSVYVRKIEFPYRRISKIKNSIRFAIEPHIPVPVESTKVFFQTVFAKHNSCEVISFVVPEALLNEQLELISSSGLVCNDIELEPLSIFNFFISKNKIKENVLWLYVAKDATYIFSALKGGKLCDLRQIPMGKDELLIGKGELKREISTILISQSSQFSENKISKIYVSGLSAAKERADKPSTEEQADRPEICDWLTENFNIPAETMELENLLSVEQPARPDVMSGAGEELNFTPTPKTLVCGFIPEIFYASLSPNGAVLNFYPPILQEKEKRGIRISASLALFALLALGFRLQFERNIYERKFNILNSRIEEIFAETFPDAVDKRTPLLQMRARIKNLKDSSSSKVLVSLSPLEALREISQNLGKDVQIELDSFRAKEGEVTVSGSASSYGDIDKIKMALENSPLFSRVDIESAQTTAQGVTFRLKIITALNK